MFLTHFFLHNKTAYTLKLSTKIKNTKQEKYQKQKHIFKVSSSEKKKKKKKKKLSYGCDKVTANIVEANREGDRSPIGSPQHRRQLQPSRQGHSPPSRRRSTRQHLQRHR